MKIKTYNNIISILNENKATLVAVSKTRTNEEILSLYNEGQRIFGENRVQELLEKTEQLPKDIEWHLIGHLQRNKVKYIAPFVAMIHSGDSLRLLEEINKQATQINRVIPVLLQFKIAQEDSKYGFKESEVLDFLEREGHKKLHNIDIAGVMGMATYTDDERQVSQEFRKLKSIFDTLKETYFKDKASFKEISMGMSGDYPIALKEGSTMVRIGSLLFEE